MVDNKSVQQSMLEARTYFKKDGMDVIDFKIKTKISVLNYGFFEKVDSCR